MSFNISSIPFFNTGNTTSVKPTATTNNVTPAAYNTDGFTPSVSFNSVSTNLTSYTMSQIIPEDPTMANKFSKWFLGKSDTFLRVGSSWLGRFFVNVVAGNIPIMTSKTVSMQISNNVNLWLGRSDLVRTGMNPYQATLLQDVGVKNVNDLSIITNPSDQVALSQMMMAASANRGLPVVIDSMMISGWVASAQQLPKYF